MFRPYIYLCLYLFHKCSHFPIDTYELDIKHNGHVVINYFIVKLESYLLQQVIYIANLK